MASLVRGTVWIGLLLLVTRGGLAAERTLRMANWVPPVHHMTQTLENWAAEVRKASGGTLDVEILKAPLAKPPGQYDLARNGVVDLAWGVPAYTPGRFPVIRLLELPFLSPNAELGSLALWHWYERNGLIDKEFGDTKLIALWVHGPGVLHTKTPVSTLADLQGMKLRVGGGGVALAAKLGAVPVALPATEAHESLQRGITSGTLFPWEAIKGFRLAELVRYHLEVPGGLYTTPFYLVMNRRSWDSLSPAQQEALRKVGGAWGSRFIGKHWDMADLAGKQLAQANGNTIRTIDAAELARWRQRLQPLFDEWVAQINKAGYDGQALLADLEAAMREYAH
ncbi:MAG: C4-dicarboxylate ABC transporter [Candidatus Tectimicrobiota bacterium]|nr:MAG: C4-dicarboxylate ABC transporter [Candidatus Tectomicrobia bacterium]